MVTDAMEMQGVRAAWTGEAAVRGRARGRGLRSSCPRSRTWPSRPSCARCAGTPRRSRASTSPWRASSAAKERLGSTASAASIRRAMEAVDRSGGRARAPRTWRAVRSPSFATRAASCPCTPSSRCASSISCSSSDARNDAIVGIPEAELARAGSRRRRSCSGRKSRRTRRRAILAAAPGFTHVIASAFVRVSAYKGTADMAESHARLLRDLQAAGRPVVLISFGSPYLLRQVPSVSVYVSAYGAADSSQRAAVAARLRRVSCEREGSGLASRLLCIRRRAPDPEARDDAARGRAGGGGLPAGRPAGSGSRGGGGGGRAARSRGRCSRWARTACSRTCSRSAISPTTTMPRPCARTRCTTWPALTKVIVDHDDGHDPGGRGQARHQQARLRVPARVSRRGQGQGHGLAPPDPLVGHRLVGAPLQGAQGQGRVPQARPGHGPRLRAGHEVRLQRSRRPAPRRRSWSAWPGRTSTRSRARGCSSRWA